MSFMDKFFDVMRLNDDEEDEYEFSNEEDDEEDDEPERPRLFSRKKSEESQPDNSKISPVTRKEQAPAPKERQPKQPNKITPIRRSGKQVAEEMEVCIIKPKTVSEEQEITETLLQGRAVVINMEGLDMEIAQRIMDFTAGSTFAIHGHLLKVSNYVFLATPANVDVSGDIQNLVSKMGLSTDL